MSFQKGHKKLGGKKKGSLNERTRAERACERAGIDPFDLLVKMATDGNETSIIQLCKHIEPPRKPVDVGIDPEKNKMILEMHLKRYEDKP